MSTFPNFSNIAGYATKKLEARKGSVYNVSKLNSWIRVISGVKGSNGDGLVMVSNPDYRLFRAAGDTTTSTIYGSSAQSGVIGTDWDGNPINPNEGQGYRPSPIIDSIEIDEGAGNLSRKASFSVKCFSKEQMELATQYFLEPGFTIFLEWGWNTEDSMKGLINSPIDAGDIASHQNFKNLTKRRKDSNGEYDNYLGYITGGGLSTEGDTWTINVKCTGFTELPAYLVNGDNAGDKDVDGNNPQQAPEYKTISTEEDLHIKRWMFAFNALPSNRKTYEIKSLESDTDDSYRNLPLANVVNYINFDEAITDKLNNKGDGTLLSRNLTWIGLDAGAKEGKGTVDIPPGTNLVGEEKFIRFGALMKIFNTMIISGLKIGNTEVSMKIDSSNCICSAFPRIFSTDKSKLLIPNANTPDFSLQKAKNSIEPLKKIPEESINNIVEYDNEKIQFPYPVDIKGGKVSYEGNDIILMYMDETTTDNEINKKSNQWGMLDDLYVNFDFATNIMKNSNLTVKDALYQILNGMSSAVNNLWDFQIIEESTPGNNNSNSTPNKFIRNTSSNTTQPQQAKSNSGEVGLIKLSIKELNFTYKPSNDTPYEFDLIGTNSIFKDSSLSMDISGMKMNQIIGTRISTKINKDTSPNLGKLFAKDLEDKILSEINSKKATDNGGTGGDGSEDDEELKEKNYLKFLDKLGNYPKVDTLKKDIVDNYDINKLTYKATFDDSQLLKMGKSESPDPEVSILMPLNFSFSIHGISGIKRGDKFKVNGIPKKYSENGFFQVVGVKHTISEMNWTTEVEGGYRNTKY